MPRTLFSVDEFMERLNRTVVRAPNFFSILYFNEHCYFLVFNLFNMTSKFLICV